MSSRFRKTFSVLFCIATVVVAFCVSTGNAHATEPVKVHLINVGSGDSILVEYNGHYALIDGGFASHVGKKKNNVSISSRCALDKYKTLKEALDGTLTVSQLKTYYSRNLFSFHEHFDNDMKTLTGQNSVKEIADTAPEYVADFDDALVEYKTKMDPYNKKLKEYNTKKKAYDDAWADYNTDKAAYDAWVQYDQAKAAYDQAKAAYDAAKAIYDEFQNNPAAWRQAHPGQQDPKNPTAPTAPVVPTVPRPGAAPVKPTVPNPGNPPARPKTVLTDGEYSFYQNNKSAFENLRTRVNGKFDNKPAVLQAFMELQNDKQIYNEKKTSALFRFYTALGYQYIYEQVDTYLRSNAYVNGGYNDCLTYLKKHGITTIDYLILTHGHKDHVGGLSAVLANDFAIGTILYNGTSYGSGNFRIFEHEMLDRKAAKVTTVTKADDDKNNTFLLGGAVKFTELTDTGRIPAYTREPDQSSSKDKDYMNHILNNQSLVYRMDYDGASALFTGDAEGINDGEGYCLQKAILKKHKNLLNVDIVKAAHHCHKNAKNTNFNKAASPRFVLTSCGKSNEPHKTARKALKGADMWLTKGNGDSLNALVTGNSFQVYDGNNKNITGTPAYRHTVDYTVKSSFGTADQAQAKFRASGRTVDAIRLKNKTIKYYNPPTKTVKLQVGHGWYFDKVQYQLSAGDRGYNNQNWIDGSTAVLKGNFRGTVYFRLYNKFGRSIIRKTDGFETRAFGSVVRRGKVYLTGYNDVYLDWYPVQGVKKYKVQYMEGGKWKNKVTVSSLYKTVKNLPAGRRINLRILPVGHGGSVRVNVYTLRKLAKPTVSGSGSQVRVSWAGVAGSSGYQLKVGSKVRNAGNQRSLLLNTPKSKKVSYKVRAYKKVNGKTIYAPWSSATKFEL